MYFSYCIIIAISVYLSNICVHAFMFNVINFCYFSRSCVKPLHSEPMAPPSPPPPPSDDVPLLKLVSEEGSGCALTPCTGTPTNNVKLISKCI